MARGDANDLFFRELRQAGLSKPAVQALCRRLQGAYWTPKRTVTWETPSGTSLGVDLPAGSQIMAAHCVIRTDFDSGGSVAIEGDDGSGGSVDILAPPNPNSGAKWGCSTTGFPLDVLVDVSLVYDSNAIFGGEENTQGDADVWLLINPPPTDF